MDGVQVRLETAPSPSDGGLLVLRGTAGPIGVARARVDSLLAEATRVTQALTQPQYDRLAARAGALPRKLQEAHGCALVPDREERTLTIIGSVEGVGRVRAALEPELDVDEHVREVPERLVPIIIGRGGSTIKQIISDSGADVNLDRATRRVTVRGRTARVAAAVALLDALAAGQQEKELRLSLRQVPLLIGRGGSNIRSLQADSRATIDIRKDDNVVRVRGTADAVDDAIRRIHELLAANGAPIAAAADGAAAAEPPAASAAAADASDSAAAAADGAAAPPPPPKPVSKPTSAPPGLKRPAKAS